MRTKRERQISQEVRDRMMAIYYGTPSVSYVARVCGVHRETVRRYRERDKWRERIAQMSGEKLAENLMGIEEMRARCERVITALMANFLERVEQGLVQIETPADLVNVGRFWLTLKGAPSDSLGLMLLPSGTPIDQAAAPELVEASRKLLGVSEGFERRLQVVDAEVVAKGNGNGKAADAEGV